METIIVTAAAANKHADINAVRREVFNLGWMFVKKNGMDISRALRCSWANVKLARAMRTATVKFRYVKVNGTLREAYGRLSPSLAPALAGSGRKPNPTLQVYYDTEKEAYRSFKRANLECVEI